MKRTTLKTLIYEWRIFKARRELQTEHDREGRVDVQVHKYCHIPVLYIVPKLAAVLHASLFDRMHRNTLDDFCMAIRPLLHVSRALGLAPLGYVRKTLPGGTISVQLVQSSPAVAYGIFVVVLHLCLFAVSIAFKFMYVFSQILDTDTVTDILLHTTSITSLVSIVLSVTKNRNAFVRIMILVSEIDSLILPCPTEYYSRANTRLINQLLVLCIFLGFTLTYDNITWSLIGLKIFAYSHLYVDTLIEWIVVIQFMNVVILLKNRFSLLNTRLSKSSGIFETETAIQGFHLPLYGRTSTRNVKEIKPQLTRKEVLTLNNNHDTLVDAVLLVKSTYEVQILFSLLSTFVGITIRSYFVLCGIYGYSTGNSKGISFPRLLLSHSLWCSLHIARLLCIVIPCHSANNHMAHTSTVLRKILLAFHTDPATMSELERFAHHVALRKFRFTVFGFLSLDLSLLVSMMGAVATYLVILMQFKINPN